MRLIATDLRHAFRDRIVLDGVSCDLSSPTLTALMGPSGAGKSTLLAIFARELIADVGNVDWKDSSQARPNWIVQSSPVLVRRTVIDNVALGPLAQGVDETESRARAAGALNRLGIEHLRNSIVNRLSGGERQRVSVARAVAADAEFILADEPTASLDLAAKSAVVASLRIASDHGALVIVATHDEFVASHCDQVLRLEAGRAQMERTA